MRARGLSVTIATYFCFAALYVCVSSTAVAEIGYKFNLGECFEAAEISSGRADAWSFRCEHCGIHRGDVLCFA